MRFTPVYIPVGVPTFHMESASDAFERSKKLLKELDPDFVFPEHMLLSVKDLQAYLSGVQPDFCVFQNLTFANAAYMSELLRVYGGPVLLWTLPEPVIDGGRLRLNSLTGAYSAANALRAFSDRPFVYTYGAPEDCRVEKTLKAALSAARIKKELRSLNVAAVGQTPEGFGFGRALDSELMRVFGSKLISVEARELIWKAESYAEADVEEELTDSERVTEGFLNTPEKNRVDHGKLLKAYRTFVRENGIGCLSSRCWPDFFTEYGTPVCAVLSMLNDEGVEAACEADVYGALSMWIGRKLSGFATFFGDPVSLDEAENTVTFWHCGMAACSLARKDTGASVGVHPNRKIGPVLDFGCEAFPEATVFRIGREPDGTFRFFIAEGEALDKPKQFIGTSLVVRTDYPAKKLVEESVEAGLEPHFVVLKGRHREALKALAKMLGIPTVEF